MKNVRIWKGIGSFSLSVLLIAFVVACTSDDNVFFGDISLVDKNVEELVAEKTALVETSKIMVREIVKEEIPFGVKPLEFDSEIEMWKFIERLESEDFEVKLSSEMFRGIKPLKTRSENADMGIVTREHIVNSNIFNDLILLITLSWTERGEDVAISSRPSNTWVAASWIEDRAIARWIGHTTIEYSVSGCIIMYLNIPGTFFEIDRKNVSLSDSANV